MQTKKSQDEQNVALFILCFKCTQKHPLKYCPLNNVQVFAICIENHTTESFHFLPGLQFVYNGSGEETKFPYQAAQNIPWKPRP